MSIVYAELRLGNAAGPDVEEITVTAVVDSGAIDLIVPVHPRLQRLMPNPDNPNLAGFIVKSAQRRPRIVTSPAMAVDRLRGWR